MNVLKNIFRFYVFGNLHVGLSTFCLTKITLLQSGVNNCTIPLFVGLATVISYNLIRIKEHKNLQPWYYGFIRDNKRAIVVLIVVCALLLLYLATFLTRYALISLLPIVAFTFFYSIPVRAKQKGSSTLRSVAFLKLFLIAVSWAVVTVIFPLVQYDITIGFNEMIIAFQRFLIIAAITVPFDIRDVDYDSTSIHTLPETVGIAHSKRIALLFLMVFLGATFLLDNSAAKNLQLHFAVALLSAILIVRTKEKNQSIFYTSFWIEAIPIFWLIAFLFLMI